MSIQTCPGDGTISLPAGCLSHFTMSPSGSHNRHRHIILIGLMGCGKTTVGRELSKLRGTPFLDTDFVIEEQLGRNIADIFSDEGEDYFRKLETTLLRYLVQEKTDASYIISTGGGIVIRPENRALLRQLGYNVWLNVDVPVLIQRTARANNRPLLHNVDPAERLKTLFATRRPMYEETAHDQFDTSALELHEVARMINQGAERHFSRPDTGRPEE